MNFPYTLVLLPAQVILKYKKFRIIAPVLFAKCAEKKVFQVDKM